jgi:vacuolar-type H+-ATPase subunit E/Vma4
MNEDECRVRVVKRDLNLIQTLVQQLDNSEVIHVDQDQFLPDEAIGGVLVANSDFTIECENTFEKRLILATRGILPEISNVLKS